MVKTKSNKKGEMFGSSLSKDSKKGDSKSNLKTGDVGLSPSSVVRPSNMQKRNDETNRSIADGSQRTILDSNIFHKNEVHFLEYQRIKQSS